MRRRIDFLAQGVSEIVWLVESWELSFLDDHCTLFALASSLRIAVISLQLTIFSFNFTLSDHAFKLIVVFVSPNGRNVSLVHLVVIMVTLLLHECLAVTASISHVVHNQSPVPASPSPACASSCWLMPVSRVSGSGCSSYWLAVVRFKVLNTWLTT